MSPEKPASVQIQPESFPLHHYHAGRPALRLVQQNALFVSGGLLAPRFPFVELGVIALEAENAAVEVGAPDHQREDLPIGLEGLLAREFHGMVAATRALVAALSQGR